MDNLGGQTICGIRHDWSDFLLERVGLLKLFVEVAGLIRLSSGECMIGQECLQVWVGFLKLYVGSNFVPELDCSDFLWEWCDWQILCESS